MEVGVMTLNAKKATRTLASLQRADVLGTSVWLFEPRGLVVGSDQNQGAATASTRAGVTVARAAIITMPDKSASVVPVPRRPAGLGFGLLVAATLVTLLTGHWLLSLGLLAVTVGLYALLYRLCAPDIRQTLFESGVLVAASP